MKSTTLKDRFISKVSFGPECWNWIASKNREGYGQLRIERKTIRAHRVCFELYVGPIPSGLCVLHKCDNPSCVRPDHLFLGNKSDNAIDAYLKGRRIGHKKHLSHCAKGHPLVPENLYQYKYGRSCKVCQLNRANEFYRKKKKCSTTQ